MPAVRKNFASTAILSGESFARMGIIAIVSFWIARHLGPEQFGVLNFASAVLAIFYAVANLGLDTLVIGRLARGDPAGPLLVTTINLRLVVGILGAVTMVVVVATLRGWSDPVVPIAAVVSLSLPASVLMTFDYWFKAGNDAWPPALARLGATLLACLAKMACVLLGLGVLAIAWTVAMEAFLMSACLAAAYGYRRNAVRESSMKTHGRQQWELLRQAVPFLVTAVAIAAFMKLDVIVLGALSTDSETGLYSLSQKLSETLYVMPIVVVEVLYPQLVRSRQAVAGGVGGVDRGADQFFFDVALAAALICTIAAVSLAGWLVSLLFGEAYDRSSRLFSVHAWSCIGIVMAHARFKWMAAHGEQHLASWLALMSLGVSIVMCWALIPPYGAAGAAVATAVGYFISGSLLTWIFPSLRPMALMQLNALWPWLRLYRHWRRAAT